MSLNLGLRLHPLHSGTPSGCICLWDPALQFGTMVKVTSLKNNKSTVVKINDRGPHGSKANIIDLSRRAAEEIDMIKDGKAKVKIEVVDATKK